MRRWQAVLGLGGIAAMVLLVAMNWSQTPATVPIHFGADGRANGYGSRVWLWFPPAMALCLYGLLSAVMRMPRWYNLPAAPGDPQRGRHEELATEMIGWLRVGLVWMFLVLAVLEIRGAQGHGGPALLWLLPTLLCGSILPIAWFSGGRGRRMAERAGGFQYTGDIAKGASIPDGAHGFLHEIQD